MKKKIKKATPFITRTCSTVVLMKHIFKRRFERARRSCDLLGKPGIDAKQGQTDEVMWRNKSFKARWSTKRHARNHMARIAAAFGDGMVTVLTRVKPRKKITTKQTNKR